MLALPRLAAGSAGAVLALAVLGAPTVALAAPGGEPPAHTVGAAAGAVAGAAGASGRPAGGPALAPSPSAAAQVEPPAARVAARVAEAPGRDTAQAAQPAMPGQPAPQRPRPAAQGKPAGEPEAARAAKPTKQAGLAQAAVAPADPRGNNGTFKVDGPVLDTSHGNEPHLDCAFRLNFFGYDAGQLATIVLTAVPPTSGPSTRVAGLPMISTSPAGGGRYGGSYPATGSLTAADLGLDVTQRQHVKVAVESVNADGSAVPGGAKHKVFWLEPCGSAASSTSPSTSTPASTSIAAPVAPATPAGRTPILGPHAINGQTAPAPATARSTDVRSGTVSARSSVPATVVVAPALGLVLPQTSATAAPAALPFTGAPQLLALLVGGLVAVAGGAALVAAARTDA